MTLQLVARREFDIFVAAHFIWESRRPDTLTTVIDATAESQSHARLLDEFDIELALSKCRVQGVGIVDIDRYNINECVLLEKAFSRNAYTVRLEKGRFITVDDAKVIDANVFDELSHSSYYSYRLIFDPSPLPPRYLWKKEAGRAPERLQFWDWKQFLARRLPSEERS